MKNKKVAALLLTMALCAGMAVPQTIVPFGVQTALAAGIEDESGSGDVSEGSTENYNAEHKDQKYPGSGILWQAYCGDVNSLKAALDNASTVAEQPTYIWITDNMDLNLAANEYVTVKAKSYVIISSIPGDTAFKISNNIASTEIGFYNCMFYDKSAMLTLENIIIDAGGNRRCISYFANKTDATAKAEINLKDGAILQNGGNATSTAFGGYGIYVDINTNKSVYVNMYEGAKIKNCHCNCRHDLTNGKAIDIEKSSGILNIYGGEISENNDRFDPNMTITANERLAGSLGAVYCPTLFMTGGSIKNNCSINVGGVYLVGTKDSEISGGEISENKVNNSAVTASNLSGSFTYLHDREAGGVYKTGKGTLTITGDAKICDNTITGASEKEKSHKLSGGGIKIADGTVKMIGGTISGNKVESTLEKASSDDYKNISVANGGGVYVQSGTFEMISGTITGNTATAADSTNTQAGNGGGVYVATDGTVASGTGATFTMSGGSISNNSATRGKDVYVSNYLKYLKSSVTSGVTTYTAVDVAGTPSVSIGGTTTKIGNIFLPEKTDVTGESVLKINGKLGEEKSIGVEVANPVEGTIIAKPEEYDLSEEDVKALVYAGDLNEDDQLIMAKDDDGQISLLGKNYAESTSIEDAEISWKDGSSDKVLTYSGDEQKPEVEVRLNEKVLEEGTDYTVKYLNNTNAGTAKVRISGNSKTGNYKGTKDKEFTIASLDIGTEDVQAKAINSQLYTGNVITPGVKLTYKGAELKAGTDYIVSYSNNTEVGTATVTITGNGNFKGERTASFEITDAEGAKIVESSVDLEKAVENAEPGMQTIIALKNDITLTPVEADNLDGVLKLPENADIQIDGYGHSITLGEEQFATSDNSATGMFVIPSGAKLTLSSDMDLDGAGKGRIAYVEKDGTLTVGADVTMTGGRATDQTDDSLAYGGQCIYNLGTTVFDGSISDNVTKTNGYGAIYNNGSFTLGKDSVLTNILVNAYGAFYNDTEGKAVMEGGTISGTACEQTYLTTNAKGIFNLGTFTMKDGAVKENEGQYSAIANCGAFIMEGGSIVDNKNDFKTVGGAGDGAILQRTFNTESAEPTFLMTGGEIVGNESMYRGGGVFVANGTFTVDGENAVIKDNTVTSKGNEDNFGSYTVLNNGGGVYVQGGTFELKKGTIEGNVAYLKTENATQKQAFNGGSWYYNSNGTPTATSGQTMGNSKDKHYGLGGAIYVDGGKLKLSGGDVKGNISVPLNKDNTKSAFEAASGIYVVDGSVEMSGAPVVSDVIYLEKGKNLTITGKLTGTEPYTVYQTENDLKLKEDCSASVGNAVATYAQGSDAYQETDGDHFKLYTYDDKYDYVADKTFTHYTAFEDGIYVNRPVMDVKDLNYVFTNADGQEEDGTYYYRFNGGARIARNTPVTASATYKDTEGNELAAVTGITNGKGIDLTIQENTGDAGTYTVTVTPDQNDQEGYHYTGSYDLTFKIAPRDLSEMICETDDDGNILYYDADGKLTDEEHGTPVEKSIYLRRWEFGDITYAADDPADKEYTPQTTVGVRLGSNRETILEEGKDYVVTATNNISGSNGTILATIEGIGNYTGKLVENYDTGIKVKALQTITAGDVSKLLNDEPFTIGAKSSDSKAALSYSTSAPGVATVDANGKVTIVGAGTAKITVTASETDTSRPVQKTITVKVLTSDNFVVSQDAEDQAMADAVTAQINNLKPASEMSEDTLAADQAAIKAAQEAYDALTEAQKALVSADAVSVLTEAEAKAEELQATADAAAAAEQKAAEDAAAAAVVSDLISKIADAETITTETYAEKAGAVTAAQAAYDALSEEQKAIVDADTDVASKLAAATAKVSEVEAALDPETQMPLVDTAQIDAVRAQGAADLINALPKADTITETTENLTEISAQLAVANAAYNALTPEQQRTEIATAAASKLQAVSSAVETAKTAAATTAAEQKEQAAKEAAVQAKADAVTAQINNLPKADAITSENLEAAAAAADAARKAYDALTDEQKAKVSKESVDAIAAVKARVEAVHQTEVLSALIQKAEVLKQTDYTADTWKTFAAALADAKNISADVTATADSIKAKGSALQKAQSALKLDISKAGAAAISAKTYTGSAIKPSPKVTWNGKALVKDTDYTIAYKNNVNKGTAKVTITGKGAYAGTKTVKFTIKAKEVKPAVKLAAKSYTWNGKAKKPAVTVTANGKTLKKGTDYTVKYSSNKNVGKATVTVTMKGNYSGSKSGSFTIKPKNTSVTKLTAGKKAVTVKWKKLTTKMSSSRIGGYQIQTATNAKFTANKKTDTVKGYKSASKKITKLKSGKKYYVRIRTYKKVGDKTYFSKWTKAKTVKVK